MASEHESDMPASTPPAFPPAFPPATSAGSPTAHRVPTTATGGAAAADTTTATAARPGRFSRLKRRAGAGARSKMGRTAGISILAVTFASGILFGVSASQSKGSQARGEVDLVSLVRERQEAVTELTGETDTLQKDINTTVAALDGREGQGAAPTVDLASSPVNGPGLTVTLTDAPPQDLPGVSADDLVIHQQDVEAVMNALYAGGAEALTVQDVRVTTRTVIRCIGNVILVDGTSYSPPYVIKAIGDPVRMRESLDTDRQIEIYKQYVTAYQLGWSVEESRDLSMPAVPQQAPFEDVKAG